MQNTLFTTFTVQDVVLNNLKIAQRRLAWYQQNKDNGVFKGDERSAFIETLVKKVEFFEDQLNQARLVV